MEKNRYIIDNNLYFEQSFCDFLEYRICNFFNESEEEHTKGFWCDGVIFETMLNDKTALFTVFTGKSGQVKYNLFLNLGETSLSLIENNSDMQSCIPASYCADTFIIDTDIKRIDIYAS
jgi:hypothetical protein